MKRNPLIIIFLVVFLDLLGFGIVIPILPYYATTFGASATELGWLMACYSGMQFLFSPFWGNISDKIGRRPVLLTCIAGLGASMLLLGLAQSLFWLFAARILAGFFGANISTAHAYIADVTSPENRAKGMGLIGAAFGLGFLFGPAFGGFLSRWGYGTGPLVAAGLALVNFLFAVMVLKEPSLPEGERRGHRAHPAKVWRSVMSRPEVLLPVLLFFLVTLGIAQLETSFALFLLARFGLDAFHAGMILAVMAIVMVGIQGGGIGRLVSLFGEKKLVFLGCALMALSLVAASFTHQLFFFVVFLLIHAVGYGMTNPSLSSLASRAAGEGAQGATMGVYQSAGSLARIFGPLLAGVLFDYAGIGIPFLVASFFFAAALMLAVGRKKVWRDPLF